MPPIQRQISKNRLLSGFPQGDFDQFFTTLEFVYLPTRRILCEAGTRIEHVYFMEEGLASLLTTMADGTSIEIGMIGREGLAGIAALLGGEVSAQRVIVQVAGTAHRMDLASCRTAFEQSAAVRDGLLHYSEFLFNLSAQTAACNSLHSVEQRCARWLLLSSDRIQSGSVPITHEFLSSMLGVRRVGVTTTVGNLERSGLIQSERGRITIVERDTLEATSCECYRADRARFDRLH